MPNNDRDELGTAQDPSSDNYVKQNKPKYRKADYIFFGIVIIVLIFTGQYTKSTISGAVLQKNASNYNPDQFGFKS